MSDGEFQIPDELRRRIEAGEDLFPEKTARAKEILKNAGIPDKFKDDFNAKKVKESKETMEKYGLPDELKKTGNPLESLGIILMDYETKKEKMTGVELIEKERLEHKVKHGKSVKHDVETYKNRELIQAVIGLLLGNPLFVPEGWDEEQYGKMIDKPEVERFIIAGSLIAAQIDVENYKEND